MRVFTNINSVYDYLQENGTDISRVEIDSGYRLGDDQIILCWKGEKIVYADPDYPLAPASIALRQGLISSADWVELERRLQKENRLRS